MPNTKLADDVRIQRFNEAQNAVERAAHELGLALGQMTTFPQDHIATVKDLVTLALVLGRQIDRAAIDTWEFLAE